MSRQGLSDPQSCLLLMAVQLILIPIGITYGLQFGIHLEFQPGGAHLLWAIYIVLAKNTHKSECFPKKQ